MGNSNYEIATFGGGCFWCTEAVFQELSGIIEIKSGFSGGNVPGKPTYREVCSGLTGHAEVIQLKYNPEIISFKSILTIFMTTHDPTTLNRQGADCGTEYRSIILYHSTEQKNIAEKVIDDISDYYDDAIVTELKKFNIFYEAEQEHQNYYKNNRGNRYCTLVIEPKLAKLRNLYS
jgi:peptide-methionine (S)-S-oxide reductase